MQRQPEGLKSEVVPVEPGNINVGPDLGWKTFAGNFGDRTETTIIKYQGIRRPSHDPEVSASLRPIPVA